MLKMDPHSFDNNITQRKPLKVNSLTDLSSITNEKSIFDTTMMSIPDSLNDDSDTINNLIEQNKKLTVELLSAHQEIENLNNENFRLKSDLQEMIRKSNTCNKICSTPSKKCVTPTHKQKILNLNQYAHHISTSVNNQNSSTKEQNKNICMKTKERNKLCIISSEKIRGSLSVTEDVFSNHFDFCHYIMPNCNVKQITSDIEQKLKGFTIKDYCLLFIGQNDVRFESEHINAINALKESLQKIKHTNVVICAPTCIRGAPIYNFKAEMFGKLLRLDLLNNDYAYLFDTNYDLSLEMFSNTTGKINKDGLRNIYNRIMDNILIDLSLLDKKYIGQTNDNIKHKVTNSHQQTINSTTFGGILLRAHGTHKYYAGNRLSLAVTTISSVSRHAVESNVRDTLCGFQQQNFIENKLHFVRAPFCWGKLMTKTYGFQADASNLGIGIFNAPLWNGTLTMKLCILELIKKFEVL
ncbi:hypothetical protein HW555_000377 [Spodoptera exigua]|uniref:Uncharacterized protein n=1 Tax=Spodoptera exigua TaxID=7107 RepID=A0A835GU34_SPOEX|nr:hypothetical protein HW555_000377 [Spodoptera exigua]